MNQAALDRQQTLSRTVEVSGVGLHSGIPVKVRLSPAPVGFGLRFVRTDVGNAVVPVNPASLKSGVRCTALQANGVGARTTEHLLAVLYAFGVDNCEIAIDAEELPILDGSGLGWVEALSEAGLSAQEAPRKVLQVSHPVVHSEGGTTLMVLPVNSGLRLTVASVTDHPVAGVQTVDLEVSRQSFVERLAPARTFCFEEEIQALRDAGLARGGSLDNTLVVGHDRFWSPLRVDQELAAHKALDLLGDLAALGRPLSAHVVAIRPGHAANQQLVRKIWGQLATVPQPDAIERCSTSAPQSAIF